MSRMILLFLPTQRAGNFKLRVTSYELRMWKSTMCLEKKCIHLITHSLIHSLTLVLSPAEFTFCLLPIANCLLLFTGHLDSEGGFWGRIDKFCDRFFNWNKRIYWNWQGLNWNRNKCFLGVRPIE